MSSFATLSPVERVDVAIVGAGVHGASAAYHLASSGVRVVVFERTVPAGGPTGRSSAVCRSYYTNAFLARMAHESVAFFERFHELTGGDAGFRKMGALFLHADDDRAQVEQTKPGLDEAGVPVELVELEEIRERFPMFDLTGIGFGVWDVDAGYADPAGTTEGLARRAQALGAELRLRTSVARIEPSDAGGATIVTADGDRVAAPRVLVAAGPWTRELAASLGIELPLSVERHIVATFSWGSAPRVPLHADIPNGYYFRPEGEDLFLVGSLLPGQAADPNEPVAPIASEEIDEHAALVVRRVAELERAEVHGGWTSFYDVSPDWQPVIGELAPGVFVDAGTSGHGFKLAPALGGEVAKLVLGRGPDPALAQFHPRRFDEHAELRAGYGGALILG